MTRDIRLGAMDGILVLDTGCYKQLRDPVKRQQFEASVRVAAWTPMPSTVNALEIIQFQNIGYRDDLLALLHELREDRPLLPWPTDLLPITADALASNEAHYKIASGIADEAIANPSRITPAVVERIKNFLLEMESHFDDFHKLARRKIRGEWIRLGVMEKWPSPQAFLSEFWMRPENLAGLVEEARSALFLEDPPAVETILESEVWRVFYEMQGIAAFDRIHQGQPPARAHLRDIVQMMYLGMWHRRMLVTDDVAFRRAGEHVVRGRYRRARVCSMNDLLS